MASFYLRLLPPIQPMSTHSFGSLNITVTNPKEKKYRKKKMEYENNKKNCVYMLFKYGVSLISIVQHSSIVKMSISIATPLLVIFIIVLCCVEFVVVFLTQGSNSRRRFLAICTFIEEMCFSFRMNFV